jgi:rhodanese-related sulfurtransferase
MKKKYMFVSVVIIVLINIIPLYASHEGTYPVKREHGGFDIKPKEAHQLLKNNSKFYLVDVRTRYEYQDIGHPEESYNIPLLFYSTNVGMNGYKKSYNKNFCQDLKDRFNTATDSLFFICRSAERSTIAVNEAIKCGFQQDNVYNVLGGFEGDKVHDAASPFYGQRMVGGWRHEGLPWTYLMKQDLMYMPDINK